MKATTRDGRRVYHQSTRSWHRSRWAWLMRLAVRTNQPLGEVDAYSVRFSHRGEPRKNR